MSELCSDCFLLRNMERNDSIVVGTIWFWLGLAGACDAYLTISCKAAPSCLRGRCIVVRKGRRKFRVADCIEMVRPFLSTPLGVCIEVAADAVFAVSGARQEPKQLAPRSNLFVCQKPCVPLLFSLMRTFIVAHVSSNRTCHQLNAPLLH